MNNNPLISVVIPTFNHAHLIKKCIKSVINQTYQNFEILIINNFSQDNTIEVIDSFKDERIKIYNYKNDGIIAKARNLGIRESNGEYIAFLDSDDSWYESKLINILEEFRFSNADVICHNMNVISFENPPYIMYSGPQKNATFDNLLFQGNALILSATVLHKNVINKVGFFSEEKKFITAEDYEFWLRIAKENLQFSFINKTLGEYLIHQNNATKSFKKNYEATKSVIMEHYKDIHFLNKLKLRNRLALLSYTSGRNCERTNRKKAILFFVKSIKKNPLIIKTYIALFFCICNNKYLNNVYFLILKYSRNFYFNFTKVNIIKQIKQRKLK
ncbi:glycosyltransferase family 2 protein [Silvanigrella sp.]|jgi:glycosyltransferase involved in cell wall biosynthesis|uniref:glycosyltransferase family 2 protein n=1 Tax=Silvanigrella sp. TaxID=2024976 RepID=UPI0037C66DCD